MRCITLLQKLDPIPIAQIIVPGGQHDDQISRFRRVYYQKRASVPQEEACDNPKQNHNEDSLRHNRVDSIGRGWPAWVGIALHVAGSQRLAALRPGSARW